MKGRSQKTQFKEGNEEEPATQNRKRGFPWSCTVWNPDKEGTKMDLRQKPLFSSENDIRSAKSDRNVSQFNLETN